MNKLLVMTVLVAFLALSECILRPWKRISTYNKLSMSKCENIICDPPGPFCLGAESFRMPRQAEEEQGYLNKVIDSFRSYYEKALDSARWIHSKPETWEGGKVRILKCSFTVAISVTSNLSPHRNLYTETAEAVVTYTRVGVDQAYYYMYPQQ